MIGLNYTNMMSDAIGMSGLHEKDISGIESLISKAHKDILGRGVDGMGFLDLPMQDTSAIKDAAKWILEDTNDLIILGIGGSALGPKTILEALSPMHNLRSRPRVFIFENVDPATLNNILSITDPSATTVNVITKSGSTAETMASFMILYEIMKDKRHRFIATTDPKKGFLRELSQKTSMRTLEVPPSVGGRFSVLTPVGLLLSEVIGVSSDELLMGAKVMLDRCSGADVMDNPAYLFGSLLYLMDKKHGRKINVFMPYSDRLKPLSEWFCQLWAESLGKQGLGLTPYPSVGTTDQHSQLQLWMEGPQDKSVVMLRVQEHGAEFVIPSVFSGSGLDYLSGHGLGELLNAEQESTELCLKKAGRPNMTLTIPYIDAYYLGALFMLLEIATAFTGFLYGINPFDQPSVEVGKNYTYAMMDRPGYEDGKAEVQNARADKHKWDLR